MQQPNRYRRSFRSQYTRLHRMAAVAIMLSMLSFVFTIPAAARSAKSAGKRALAASAVSGETLRQAGLMLDITGTNTAQTAENGFDFLLNRVNWQIVRVICDGTVQSVKVHEETVYDVLASLHITLGENDLLSCPLETETYTGLTIRITRITYATAESDVTVPAEDTVYFNSVMSPSQETVLQQGSDGTAHLTEKVTYFDGREAGRQTIKKAVTKAAVSRVVIRGSDSASMPVASGANTLVTSGGQTLSYSRVIDGVATAYNCPGYVGHTASGTIAQVGKVAVDPRVIPLGTKLYIVSQDGQYVYGYCIAEDTGGLIKGNKIDLYFSTWNECIQFGYRPITIYVVA